MKLLRPDIFQVVVVETIMKFGPPLIHTEVTNEIDGSIEYLIDDSVYQIMGEIRNWE